MAEEKTSFSLREAAQKLNLSEMYVRTLIRKGTLQAVKNEYGFWTLSAEVVQAYGDSLKEGGRGHNRSVGTKAFIIHVPVESEDAVAEYLKEQGITLEKRSHYNPEKSKEYRQKRALKKSLEKADAGIAAARANRAGRKAAAETSEAVEAA